MDINHDMVGLLGSKCTLLVRPLLPHHRTSAKCNDKNISGSDCGQIPRELQMTQSFGGL